MKINIVYLLLIALLGITVSASIAQQNQNVPKTDAEVEKLKIQLQTVENEKMEIETKLAEAKAKHADANAKLINTDIDKLKGELRESNNDWLRAWTTWFWTIIGIFVAILLGVSYVFWYWLRSRTDQLIANSVENSLTGFKEVVGQVDIQKNELKEAVGQVNILENQIEVLEKEHAASVLEGIIGSYPYNRGFIYDKPSYPERIKVLQEDVLLQVFGDERYNLVLRRRAIEVLAARKSPRLVSPVLEFLNSVIDSDLDIDYLEIQACLHDYIDFLADMETPEAYQGLKKLCDRLITENLRYKWLFLKWTVLPLGRISFKLEMKDAVSMLRKAIPDLKVSPLDHEDVIILVKYFDMFNEPEGIKEILTHHADKIPELKEKCLELLEKYDANFVKEWKEKKETTNTESEES